MVRVREFESYVSATQLSERLGGRLVPSALRYRARAGMIPGAIKIGSRMFFPPRAVDANSPNAGDSAAGGPKSARGKYANIPRSQWREAPRGHTQ